LSTRRIQTPSAFAELYRPHREKVFYGGRAGAKSTAVADALLIEGDQKPLLILCAREIQRSMKQSVKRLLENQIERHGLTGYKVFSDLIKHDNGTTFFFEGLWNNIDSIKSIEGVDRCWVEEAQSISDSSLAKLIPTIRKPGSEIWYTFNPSLRSDAVYQRFIDNQPPPGAYVKKVSYRDNPWLSEESKQEIAFLKETDYEEYLHIYEGELKQFADGAIYRKQLLKAKEDGRVCRIPVESGVEVHTFWDLGRNDSTAIWFAQCIGREHRFIDYYENRGEDLDHYARVIKQKDYLYGTHYLPHDAKVTDLSAKKSRKRILEDGGVRPAHIVPRIDAIENGIAITRQAFARCWFDEVRCERGLEALSNYQYTYDEEKDTFRKVPLHNWASNGADAFRQYAQGFKESTPREEIRFAGWG
jgi:phage terminase large subunit